MSQGELHLDQERLVEAHEASQNLQRWFIGEGQVGTDVGDVGLAGRIVEHTGGHLGKYEPPVSLSTHIINTVVVGLNAYVYDRVVRAGKEPDEEQVLLLMAALALHDTNKYVEQEYEPDFDTSGNSTEVLDYYFDEGDDFGVKEILPGEGKQEVQQDVRDIKWLIQRTETKEDGGETRGESTRRVRGLERYCRIGDGFVSKVGAEGLREGVDWFRKRYSDEGVGHVQYIRFTALEQPILGNHLLQAVKAVIGGKDIREVAVGEDVSGIVLGSTNNSIAYLGEPLGGRELRDAVEDVLMEIVAELHDFDCKTEWRSFDVDILGELDLGLENKREIIAQGYAETLERGSGTDYEFEEIPEDYKEFLPELAHLVFNSQDFEEGLENLDELRRLKEQVQESDEYNNQTWKIGYLAEIMRRRQGAVDDGYDPETLQDELSELRDRVKPDLESELAVDQDAGELAVTRFFGDVEEQWEVLPSADSMCFLCGREASSEYQKGNDGFYGTNKFSRRVPPEGQYKRICPVCNLEHELLRDHCESLNSPVGDDTEIAFVYYDEFLAGVTVGENVVYDFMDDDEGLNLADPSHLADSLAPQFHLQPFYAGGENRRLGAVRSLLDTLVSQGMKVVVGKPFTSFRPEAALFADLNPSRRQVSFGADRVRTQDERRRLTALFEILGSVAANSSSIRRENVYLSVPDDRFSTLADLVVQETENYSSIREQTHKYFSEHQDKERYMLMRDVAQQGLELYGEQYDSRHKKTKILREAIDATLDGLNRNKDESELREHVAGQVYKVAQTEQYAPYTTTEKAENFVDTFFEYLREEESLDKASLSRRRNALTNTYLFAYDQLLNERNEERSQEA